MDFNSLISLKVLPSSVAKNEEEYLHLPYKEEAKILNGIRKGDINELKKLTFLKSIPVGKLSGNSVKQYRYIAICFITLAVRSAISGGMNENEAYSFGDYFIQRIDRINSCEEIINQIALGAIKLTNSVGESRKNAKYSPHIRKCIQYVNDNLNKKITVSRLAEICGVSGDYLSSIFKKEYGMGLSDFILTRKLEAARTMLTDGVSQCEICYTLAFSSQSHFINSFKKKYGITPGQFRAAMG